MFSLNGIYHVSSTCFSSLQKSSSLLFSVLYLERRPSITRHWILNEFMLLFHYYILLQTDLSEHWSVWKANLVNHRQWQVRIYKCTYNVYSKRQKDKESSILVIARLSSWITMVRSQSTFNKSTMDNWNLLVIPQTDFM